MKKFLVLLLVCLFSFPGLAKVPPDYSPVVVEVPFSLSERLIDLNQAIEVSRQSGKPMFIYLGAPECPPCVMFEALLRAETQRLVPAFSNVVLVDIRAHLRGPKLRFKVGDRFLSFQEFNELVGIGKKELWWPFVWLVGPDLKAVRQMPAGSGRGTPRVYEDLDQLLLLLKSI